MKKIFTILLLILAFSFLTKSWAQYNVLLDFAGTNGIQPQGTLLLSGNTLYGTASSGGALGYGVVFAIQTNGSGYRDLYDFNNTNGASPCGSLTLAGNRLFGMTNSGGAYDSGCIFSVDTMGNGYKDLFDFHGTYGKQPFLGSLTIQGNKMYGMTFGGGANKKGALFAIDTDGSNYKKLLDFNGVNGASPEGSLLLCGTQLYGAAMDGGAHNAGCVFSIDTNGTGYRDMFDFNVTNGSFPTSNFIISSNKLYGMSQGGGLHNIGTIFSIDTDGTAFTIMHNFNDSDGATPYGPLLLSGGVLYGMTYYGGINHLNTGVIFSIDTNGTGFRDLFNFTGFSYPSFQGSNPYGGITYSNGVFYGTTYAGGNVYSRGAVFSFGPCLLNAPVRVNNTSLCYGDSTGSANGVVLGGTPPYTYSWTPYGGTNDTAAGLSAGTYTLTVTDNTGCTTKDSATITQHPRLNAMVSVNNYVSICTGNDGSATCYPAGGSGSYTYQWSNGKTSSTVTGLSAGTYTVIVRDGCSDTASATVAMLNATTVTFSQKNVVQNWTVPNGVTQVVIRAAGGQSGKTGDTYLIYDGANGAVVTGTFSVTPGEIISVVTGGKGGSSYKKCGGGGGGSFVYDSTTLNLFEVAGGGGGPYWVGDCTYADGPGAPAGTDVITNAPTSCIRCASGGTGGNGGLSSSGAGGAGWLSNGADAAQPDSCKGGNDRVNFFTGGKGYNGAGNGGFGGGGGGGILDGGGGGGYNGGGGGGGFGGAGGGGSYLSGTQLGPVLANNAGDGYVSFSYVVIVTELSDTSQVIQNVTCPGGNNGSISANVKGGLLPYKYSWAPTGGTNAIATGLTAGTYTVTVMDSCGTTLTASASITQPNVINIVPNSVNANAGCNGSAWVTVSGGTPSYSYLWNGGQTTDTITNQCAGNYCCVITDANGCVDSTCVTINTVTGINNVQSKGAANIFPNPNNGVFTITVSTAEIVEVYNVLGENIYSGKLNAGKTELNLSNQSAGIYLYRVLTETGNSVSVGKLIIEK